MFTTDSFISSLLTNINIKVTQNMLPLSHQNDLVQVNSQDIHYNIYLSSTSRTHIKHFKIKPKENVTSVRSTRANEKGRVGRVPL